MTLGMGQLSHGVPDFCPQLVGHLSSNHSFPPPTPQVLTSKGDAWAKYMAEVKKYKAHQCGDDDKTRPLVK